MPRTVALCGTCSWGSHRPRTRGQLRGSRPRRARRDRPSRRSIMLKFLTHKLRTHSLNEDNVSEKVGVAASRLRDPKVTAARKWPPREQRSGTRPQPTDARFVLQVEERDSGTESDDEAERTRPGEYRTPHTRTRTPAGSAAGPDTTSLPHSATRTPLAAHLDELFVSTLKIQPRK